MLKEKACYTHTYMYIQNSGSGDHNDMTGCYDIVHFPSQFILPPHGTISKFGSVGEEMDSSLCAVAWILPPVLRSVCGVLVLPVDMCGVPFTGARQLRVWSRECVLQSTCEPMDQLGQALHWM